MTDHEIRLGAVNINTADVNATELAHLRARCLQIIVQAGSNADTSVKDAFDLAEGLVIWCQGGPKPKPKTSSGPSASEDGHEVP